jgi:hypothetical protein
MTTLGYDAANFANIPADAQYAFVYGDGRYAVTESAIAARFPHGLRGRWISVMGTADVDIDDCENGAITVAQLPGRITAWNSSHPGGPVKVVYCDRSTLPQVQERCAGLEYRVWLATLDGSQPAYYCGASIVAVQYQTVNGAYDVSAIFDADWAGNWLVHPPATP